MFTDKKRWGADRNKRPRIAEVKPIQSDIPAEFQSVLSEQMDCGDELNIDGLEDFAYENEELEKVIDGINNDGSDFRNMFQHPLYASSSSSTSARHKQTSSTTSQSSSPMQQHHQLHKHQQSQEHQQKSSLLSTPKHARHRVLESPQLKPVFSNPMFLASNRANSFVPASGSVTSHRPKTPTPRFNQSIQEGHAVQCADPIETRAIWDDATILSRTENIRISGNLARQAIPKYSNGRAAFHHENAKFSILLNVIPSESSPICNCQVARLVKVPDSGHQWDIRTCAFERVSSCLYSGGSQQMWIWDFSLNELSDPTKFFDLKKNHQFVLIITCTSAPVSLWFEVCSWDKHKKNLNKQKEARNRDKPTKVELSHHQQQPPSLQHFVAGQTEQLLTQMQLLGGISSPMQSIQSPMQFSGTQQPKQEPINPSMIPMNTIPQLTPSVAAAHYQKQQLSAAMGPSSMSTHLDIQSPKSNNLLLSPASSMQTRSPSVSRSIASAVSDMSIDISPRITGETQKPQNSNLVYMHKTTCGDCKEDHRDLNHWLINQRDAHGPSRAFMKGQLPEGFEKYANPYVVFGFDKPKYEKLHMLPGFCIFSVAAPPDGLLSNLLAQKCRGSIEVPVHIVNIGRGEKHILQVAPFEYVFGDIEDMSVINSGSEHGGPGGHGPGGGPDDDADDDYNDRNGGGGRYHRSTYCIKLYKRTTFDFTRRQCHILISVLQNVLRTYAPARDRENLTPLDVMTISLKEMIACEGPELPDDEEEESDFQPYTSLTAWDLAVAFNIDSIVSTINDCALRRIWSKLSVIATDYFPAHNFDVDLSNIDHPDEIGELQFDISITMGDRDGLDNNSLQLPPTFVAFIDEETASLYDDSCSVVSFESSISPRSQQAAREVATRVKERRFTRNPDSECSDDIHMDFYGHESGRWSESSKSDTHNLKVYIDPYQADEAPDITSPVRIDGDIGIYADEPCHDTDDEFLGAKSPNLQKQSSLSPLSSPSSSSSSPSSSQPQKSLRSKIYHQRTYQSRGEDNDYEKEEKKMMRIETVERKRSTYSVAQKKESLFDDDEVERLRNAFRIFKREEINVHQFDLLLRMACLPLSDMFLKSLVEDMKFSEHGTLTEDGFVDSMERNAKHIKSKYSPLIPRNPPQLIRCLFFAIQNDTVAQVKEAFDDTCDENFSFLPKEEHLDVFKKLELAYDPSLDIKESKVQVSDHGDLQYDQYLKLVSHLKGQMGFIVDKTQNMSSFLVPKNIDNDTAIETYNRMSRFDRLFVHPPTTKSLAQASSHFSSSVGSLLTETTYRSEILDLEENLPPHKQVTINEVKPLTKNERMEISSWEFLNVFLFMITGVVSALVGSFCEQWAASQWCTNISEQGNWDFDGVYWSSKECDTSTYLYYWTFVIGILIILSVLEIFFMYYIDGACAMRLSKIAGLQLWPLDDDRAFVTAALARTALEIPHPIRKAFGVDPLEELSSTRLCLSNPCFKTQIGITTLLLRVLFRRALTRVILKAVAPILISVILNSLVNAFLGYKCIRAARVVVLGPRAVVEIADKILESWKIEENVFKNELNYDNASVTPPRHLRKGSTSELTLDNDGKMELPALPENQEVSPIRSRKIEMTLSPPNKKRVAVVAEISDITKTEKEDDCLGGKEVCEVPEEEDDGNTEFALVRAIHTVIYAQKQMHPNVDIFVQYIQDRISDIQSNSMLSAGDPELFLDTLKCVTLEHDKLFILRCLSLSIILNGFVSNPLANVWRKASKQSGVYNDTLGTWPLRRAAMLFVNGIICPNDILNLYDTEKSDITLKLKASVYFGHVASWLAF